MPTRDTTGLSSAQLAVILAVCGGLVVLAGYGIMVCRRREQKNARGEASGDVLEVTIGDDDAGLYMIRNPTFSEQTPDERTPDYGRMVRQITADAELQFPGENAGVILDEGALDGAVSNTSTVGATRKSPNYLSRRN